MPKTDPQAQLLDALSDNQALNIIDPSPKLLVERNPVPSTPPGVAEARLLPLRTGESLANDVSLAKDIEWAAEGFFPFGGLSIVYGLPKSGKTTLVMHLARCIVLGEIFLERSVRAGNVLWLDLEQHERLTRRKIVDEGALNGLGQVFAYNGPPPRLQDVELTAVHVGAQVVVVDSLSSLLLLEDENDNAEITRRLTAWRELIHRRNLALIAIHHSRKSEGSFGVGMRGGNAYLGVSDVALEVKRLHNSSEEDDGRRKLVSVSRYDEANETMIVGRVDMGYEVEESPEEKRQRRVLTLLGRGPLTTREIAQRLKLPRSTIQRAVEALLSDDLVIRSGTGSRDVPFTFEVAGNKRHGSPPPA